MLHSIHIKNIVLIDSLELELNKNFTALTGETGAGKSIILTALGLLLGKKADASVLRFGSDSGEVVGEFTPTDLIKRTLSENDLEENELVIRRKILADGKSKIYVNDSPISLKLLQEIGTNLVEIHSQHEQSTLLEPSKQRDIIDKFAKLENNLAELASSFTEWKSAEKELEERKAKIQKARDEEDYLRHVLDELKQLNPKKGEEEKLADLRRAMKELEKTALTMREVEEELSRDKNIESALLNAQKTLIRAGNDKFKNLVEIIERASISVAEIFTELENITHSFDANPANEEETEARLFAIRGLARKYDSHPDQLPELMEEVQNKLSLLSNEEIGIKNLQNKVAELNKIYFERANKVSEARKKAAAKIEKLIVAELKPLAMGSTKFEVCFTECEPTSRGIDKVEFFAATNPGTPVSALAEIASGGEISRFMLALKVVLLNASSAPTIIFDEIDTGTGGSVAAAIGECLARLGKELQVFVVTHLPQVAAHAKNHIRVEKKSSKGKAVTSAILLSNQERKEELARMLAGSEITSEARAAAEKLLG